MKNVFKICYLSSRIYAEKFLNRNPLNTIAIERLLSQFRRTESVQYEISIRKKLKHENTEFAVIASGIWNPRTIQKLITKKMSLVKQANQEFSKNKVTIPLKYSFTKNFTQAIMQYELNFACRYSIKLRIMKLFQLSFVQQWDFHYA